MITERAPHLLEDPRIASQLDELIDQLANRLLIMCSPAYDGWQAPPLADAIAGRSTRFLSAQQAVEMVLLGLVDDPTAAEFWGTPLGRACAFWGDGKPGVVTRAAAAAALGCTRQNISLMLRSGRLSEPVDAGTNDLVSTASLAHAMRLKHPVEV